MVHSDDRSEIWFERLGPSIGWLCSYSPITGRGLYVLLGHVFGACFAIGPILLLEHANLLSPKPALFIAGLIALASGVSLMRTAHRHSVPRC